MGLGFTLTAPLTATPQSGPDRILNELVAVHPYSSPGAMTSTPDGKYLYVAEGGSIAIIQADPTHPNATNNYKNPRKRRPVGSRGVLPVNMVLDPEITLPEASIGYEPTYGPNDLLYIAGGRDGLWVMQADVTAPAQPNLAFRVDDATIVAVGSDQDSRRWCSDVDLITLGTPGDETTYLLALFAAKDDSELRMYKLADVRNVVQAGLTSGNETGNEIVAFTKTPLGRHAGLGAGENLFSFAFGMDVDEVTGRVYVAMGYHGIARVKMKNVPPYPFAQWGPYFGDGSEYAQQIDSFLYGDLQYWESGTLVFEHPPPSSSTSPSTAARVITGFGQRPTTWVSWASTSKRPEGGATSSTGPAATSTRRGSPRWTVGLLPSPRSTGFSWSTASPRR